MDNVNLKRLAKELNLAVSTVSRALRDSHEIGKETKERVRALAEKLGFQPNPHASSLRQNKSKTIAVIVPEVENNFFSQVINGIESVAPTKGYHVLIYLTHEDFKKERDVLQLLRNGRVDGLMLSLSNTTSSFSHLEAYRQAGIPLVLFDRICETIEDVPMIITDDTEMGFRATEHLVKKGCKNIAYLYPAGESSIATRRGAGYQKALAKYLPAQKPLLIECSTNDTQNQQAIRKLLRNKKDRPDGIFAAIEKLAVNTYEVCHELQISIPQELKVISFSNLRAAALFNPPLSCIVQPAYEMGRESATILFKMIEKKLLLPNEKKIVLPSKLIERESTAG
ncbi:MAG: LacI family DNA-binding transcriptional regulator [Chitinophagaceae bacterium]